MGETFYVSYVLYVLNTRLESIYTEKYSVLVYKIPYGIFPTGSFPDFPKFSGGNFPDGKFPGFPEMLWGKFSQREVSRISSNFS